MRIFLDESGTFSAAPESGAFCVVAAYVVPERAEQFAYDALNQFKKDAGYGSGIEVKRRSVAEDTYFRFLEKLGSLEGIAIALATDAGLNAGARTHQDMQANKIAKNEPRMVHPEGKASVRRLVTDLRSLSVQNYIELVCRTHLAWSVIKTATLYFVQRDPETLARFEWRFDQKDISQNRFETTFKTVSIGLMQSISFRDPIICVEGLDYSYFDAQFAWTGDDPDWLPPVNGKQERIDAGKIWRTNHRFVDSAADPGVQIADLVSSGIYGCLRGRFANNDQAAFLLGRLMVCPAKGSEVIQLIALAEHQIERPVASSVARRVAIMRRAARPMLNSQT